MNYFVWQQQRKHGSKLAWFLAFFFTALFYATFFVLFTIRQDQPGGKVIFYKRITFLNQQTRNPEKNRLILPWLEYGTPALIAKPDEDYGYSAFIKKRSFRPPDESVRRLPDSYITLVITPPAFQYLPVAESNSLERLWEYEPLGVPAFLPPPKITRAGAFPRWQSRSGELYPQLFADPEALQPRIAKLAAAQPTELEAYHHDQSFIPQVKILRSCGDRELDQLAMTTFLKKYRLLGLRADEQNPVQHIVIDWKG